MGLFQSAEAHEDTEHLTELKGTSGKSKEKCEWHSFQKDVAESDRNVETEADPQREFIAF